jgi:hypothetical protein
MPAHIVFASDIWPDKAIIHDTDTFRVQWKAFNAGDADSPGFIDRLVITHVAEGCPGSDDQEHPIVFDSDVDGNWQDFFEQPLPAGIEGNLMQPSVGPFPVGSYRLTVTLARDLSNMTSYHCIGIVPNT